MPALEGEAWTALGDPTRRQIFRRLGDRPLPVGKLAEGLPVSRPAVSQHLRVLRDASLVAEERAGNRRIYRVDPHRIRALRADLEEFWAKGPGGLQRPPSRDQARRTDEHAGNMRRYAEVLTGGS